MNRYMLAFLLVASPAAAEFVGFPDMNLFLRPASLQCPHPHENNICFKANVPDAPFVHAPFTWGPFLPQSQPTIVIRWTTNETPHVSSIPPRRTDDPSVCWQTTLERDGYDRATISFRRIPCEHEFAGTVTPVSVMLQWPTR